MAPKETSEQKQKGKRILIVDDCPVNRALMQQYLERAGYALGIAANGHRALEVFKHKRFDLILMDLEMPLMNGYEAARRIRKAEGGRQNEKIKQLKIRPDMPDSDHKCACSANNAQPEKHACSEEDCKCKRAEADQNSKSETRNFYRAIVSRDDGGPKSEINEVPIIGMSGHDPESVKGECFRAGMNDFIGKPLQRESLVSVVRKWTAADSGIPQNKATKDELNRPRPVTIENQPPIDIEKAIKEFMGKTDLLWEVLNTFKTRVRTQIMNIKQHISVKNFNPILSEAHAIKGGAGNLGALNLSQAAAELEKAAGEESSAKASSAADDLEKEFQRLYQYIEQSDMGKAISK